MAAPPRAEIVSGRARGDVELDREHLRLQVIVMLPDAEAKPGKGDGAVDVEQKPARTVTWLPSALVSTWCKATDVELDGGAGVEGQPDVAARTAAEADGRQAAKPSPSTRNTPSMLNEPMPNKDMLALSADLDGERVGAQDELEATADVDHVAEPRARALQHQAQAGRCSMSPSTKKPVRIGGQDVRLGSARNTGLASFVGLEADDGLRRGVGVHFQQELAADATPGMAPASARPVARGR